MKILITGANGQLGREMVNLFTPDYEVSGYGREELDVTNYEHCKAIIRELRPDIILHCAAYTAVDNAESDPVNAYEINALGTRNVCMAAEAVGAKICYISTDYVFDGESATPYSEKQLTNPKSVYGKSKLAGENYVKSLSSKYFIVRTSWVFGFHGNNFVKTMLRLSEENTSLKVVNDQIGSPTYTLDLSIFIRHLVMTEDYGVYHATNTGECSWFEFANEIFKQSNISIDLVPCSTEHLSRPAPRPKYSVLKHEEILEKNMPELRSWREALSDFLKLLN